MPKKLKLADILDYGIYRILMVVLDLQNNHKFKKIYGDFGFGINYKKSRIRGLDSESGIVYGAIAEFIRSTRKPISTLLLPGENNSIKKFYSEYFSIPKVTNAGILEGMDFFWDFEKNPPDMGKFQLIVSQAILEHLVNPYKHFEDLSHMLEIGGYLIIHTEMPGFLYHRYPIDCQRFYPDWFEEMGTRMNLRIESKNISNGHIFYMYCKDR
jgi:hypothetical protein